MRRCRWSCSLATITAGIVAGCDGATAPAGNGRIEVTVTADPTAPAGVGYTLTLNGGDPRLLPGTGETVYTGVPPGTHLVHLFGLPRGCEVEGANPRVVEISGGGTRVVGFSVTCPAPETGGFRIEVVTTGEPLDEDGYQLLVAGAPLRVVEVNALEIYPDLAPGVHLITLKDVLAECRLRGGNPQPFTVVPGKSVLIRLQVICGGDPGPQ
jgi:hypothetical protein